MHVKDFCVSCSQVRITEPPCILINTGYLHVCRYDWEMIGVAQSEMFSNLKSAKVTIKLLKEFFSNA
jgi:hypothetical protein